MGIFSSINIAATGMSAERLRTDVIFDNIANASTTSSQEGGYSMDIYSINKRKEKDTLSSKSLHFSFNFFAPFLLVLLLFLFFLSISFQKRRQPFHMLPEVIIHFP